MARIVAPPSQAKLIAQRVDELHAWLNKVAYGRLKYEYDPASRIYSIGPGQGATEYGFRLFDGELFLMLQERYVVSSGQRQLLAYRYQLSWPNEEAYKHPDDWIFRFDYDADWVGRSGFAGEPHMNAHHPQPVGPERMHYPTLGLFPAETFFSIVQTHFPQERT